MEQKNNGVYSINAINTTTNETNDRIYNNEQGKQTNAKRRQTASTSENIYEDVSNTSFSNASKIVTKQKI